MAIIYKHGSFLFFVYVCVACLLGICGIAGTGFSEFWQNLFTVAFEIIVGAGVTIFFIDRLNEFRATDSLKRRLIREAGSRSHDIAISAVEWMDREGWLSGEAGLLKGADLREARLSEARLGNANLEEAYLDKADLRKTTLNGANLRKAKLTQACLQNAKLNNSDLQEADLGSASLEYADLTDTNFEKAELGWCNLKSAGLMRACFRNAVLINANLESARLYQTDMRNAELIHASLEGAEWLNTVNWEGAKSYALNLRRIDLRETNMRGMDLSMADLRNAILYGTNLHRANLYGVLLEGARFSIYEIPREFIPTRIFPKTDWTNATLPDGTIFTSDMDNTAIYRFTKPSHPEFETTIATIKAIRRSRGLNDSDTN